MAEDCPFVFKDPAATLASTCNHRRAFVGLDSVWAGLFDNCFGSNNGRPGEWRVDHVRIWCRNAADAVRDGRTGESNGTTQAAALAEGCHG